jgi:hypothetical protein
MDADAAWAAEQPRLPREEAEAMIGRYTAYLTRAIRCLPPSDRAAAVDDVIDLIVTEFGVRL